MNVSCCFPCFFGYLCLFGCRTFAKNDAALYSPLDYSEEDAIITEIGRIQKLCEQPEQQVQALWRARLLVQNTEQHEKALGILHDCEQKVVAAYLLSLEQKNYLDALRLYQSLQAEGYAEISMLEKNEADLKTLTYQEIPALRAASTTESSEKVSSYIKGTVTVFVDKGIKIERGMGMADGVLGSGFFISSDGYIVTNHHVIVDCVNPKYEGFTRLYIRLADDPDTRIPAKVVGYDSVMDLALLKAEIDAPYVFSLGSSSDLDVGDRIYAIGSPLGLERTLTSGIVSATDRRLFTLGKVFQIDAPLNVGNSGGPIIDTKGNVQAIVFAGLENYQGLNFAIPVEYLRSELPFLFNGGNRVHPWIASYGRTKREPGVNAKNEGVSVQYCMPAGSARMSGIDAGDTITGLNGTPIASLDSLQNAFMLMQPGTIVNISAEDSQGRQKVCNVYLEPRPEHPGYVVYKHDILAYSFVPLLGMELVPISTISSRKYSIVSVLKGSTADNAGFSENDPVDVLRVEFNADRSAMYVELYARKRKNGYLDVSIALAAATDSPYYF